MSKYAASLRMLFITCLFLSVHSLSAQIIVHQVDSEIPVSYELIPENMEFESEVDMAKYILNISEDILKSKALAEGQEIIEQNSTIYIDGDKIAVESSDAEMGRTTMVSDTKSGKMNMILWSQKKVLVMTRDDMKKMEEKSKQMTESMLQNIPPEMQEQVRAEMAKQKNAPAKKHKAQPTGKKMKKYGFDCEQYLVVSENKTMSIWAANDNFALGKSIESISAQFKKMFNSENADDVDEWALLSGKIPVVVASVRSDMSSGGSIVEIQAITQIEKKKPSADKFKIPGTSDGFTTGSYMEMMMQMMPDQQN